MSRPDVSIVLLTWNRAPFLEICLEKMFASLRATDQGGPRREIILMDNGSTDATPDVLARYLGRDDVKVVRNKKNYGINAYKRLFFRTRGKVIIEVDDDILGFPDRFDEILIDYLDAYPDYGYLALNVLQNDKTDGHKPPAENYHDVVRGDKIVEDGPTGGWCTAFRQKHYRLLKYIWFFWDIDFKTPEDAYLASFFWRLKKKIGIIKPYKCFHASGPAYAKEFGLLAREIEKYEIGKNPEFAALNRAALEVIETV